MDFSVNLVQICCLFLLLLVRLKPCSGSGSVLLNASVGPGWIYHIDRDLTPGSVLRFIHIQRRTGVVFLSKVPRCGFRRRNSFPVYVQLRSLTDPQESIVIRLRLLLHSRDCVIRPAGQSVNSAVSVHLTLRSGTVPPCALTDHLRSKVHHHLPHFLRRNQHFQISCAAKGKKKSFSGGLSPECLTSELEAVCALWDARSHRTSTLVLLKLRPADPPADVTPVFAKRRRRAPVNSAPHFQLPNYQVSVPENEPARTRVITLKALDGDLGAAGQVSYHMEALFDSRSNDYFQIDPFTGGISTLQPLDREVKDTHVFRVVATDNGEPRKSSTAYLTVTVSDTNDHGPVFEQTEYRISIRENVEAGFEMLTIRASDGDAPSNGNMIYRIISEEDTAPFEIHPRTGVVRVTERPDRERVAQYRLVVEASDQGRNPGPLTSTATMFVSVEDENDNYPQFIQRRHVVQMLESVAANTRVTQVEATDEDEGDNGKVHYSIISGNVRGQFYIHSLTGVIFLISPLDHETVREYNLRVKAQDGGRPPLINTTGLVVVRVVDVNDNAPMFVSTPFQATVLENMVIGHSVIHIQAIDADSGNNSHLEYRLTDAAPDVPFTINKSTGWVTVTGELDRETTEFYMFGVEAVDHGVPAMSSSASVSLTVLDVNDNVPTYTQALYNIKINEDAAVGTSVLLLSAVDRDANSIVIYQISSGNTRNRFSITSQSAGGLITLALPLDYKQERQYVLTVTASDGTLQDAVQVYVNVTDANTHQPVFQSTNYQVMLSEDRPVGSTVVTISATDEDTGENARISYIMEDNVPQFKIHPGTGAITTQTDVDYEDQASYTLAIIAHDHGIPQKSDTTYVEIIVLDANDNAPQFHRDLYQGSVFEDAPVHTSVLQICASDRDSGANGRVSYAFHSSEDGDFFIEPYSGIIRTARKLDRENVEVYHLRAVAVDKGVPPLRATVDVQVSVLDINDNAPVFEEDEMNLYVTENSPVGSVIARITATDPDEGTNAQILFQIVEGNVPEVFQLDIFNGDLIALADLDYESKSKYTIIVQATSAPLVSRATVHIHLLDVNDNVPVLQDFEIIFNNYITNRSDTFPAGVIGSVPARDPDVTDKLRFSFLEGNELNLLILNQASGELQLSRDLDNNRPLEASMKIRVSDGVHQVTALCLLRVSIVTDDMLTNSVTVRLDNMSLQHFLSPLLSLFVDAMAAVLSTRRDHVFVFSIQNDSQVERNVLNLTLSAMQPSEDHDALGGGVLSSETLQEQIYLNRTLLTLLSNQNVLPFDDNVCLREPCENYMKCVSALSFHSTAAFTASDTLLFRSIQPAGGLRCRCPPGFTGETCNMEVDQCYSSPCLNGGTCHRTEGGFNCQCPQRLSGARCQVDSGSGRCISGVCKNGGRCVDLQVGGFVCQCPDGDFQTAYCEETSRSFPRRSFITYSGLRQRFRFHLSFRFVTRDRDALLLYNGRFNHRHDFIALEIVSEQVQLSFSAGENRTSVETFVEGGVSDGEWHSVHLHYYNKPSIGRLGPSGEKVAVVAVDDCDVELAIRFGSRIRNYSCAAQSAQTGPKKSLDLTGPLLLGGVADLPEDLPVRSRDFEGCIRDLNIDGRQVDMARFIANNGTNAGCLVKQDFCSRTFCLNGGVCVNRWSSYSCQCPLGFGGQNCEHVMPSPLKFNGKALVWWAEPEVTISVPWYLGLMFRTRHRAGTLLKADAGESSRIHLLLSSSHLSFQVFVGVKRVALLDFHQTRVDDGEWHHVLMELKSSKDGKDVEYMAEVSLDYGLFQRTVEIGNELPGLRLKSLFVGGLMKKNGSVVNGWRGCIQGIRMGQTSMKLANVDLRRGQKVGVEDGCDVADSCRDAVCPPHSHCKDLWKGHACICLPGFFGRDCVDACLLNPCQNNSTCVHQPSSAHGYSCHCGDRYHGDYCQYRSDLPCARGWWGGPVCGPCNCDVSKGFDRDCNKTSGECRCKENYFRPHGGDFCLPCDCFQLGSVSRTCDTQTGQCLCRTGVIGRQCNTCDNPYAEVTSRGCVVVYDVCPRVFESGLWWPRTKFNQPAAVRCPRGSTGTAVRHCDEQNGWLRPLLFNCTSLSFRHLHYQEEELQRNGSRLDGERSRRIAVMLREATNEKATLHGGDLQTAFSLLSLLLQYESQQHGFNMAATQDRHFHQNIVQAGSVLLERSGELQHQVQRSEGGASRLLTNFELYAQTLAENMRKTYLKPFIILTPNIIFSVDFLDGSRMKPRLSDIQTELPVDLQAAVDVISHDDFKTVPVSMETPAERPGDVSQTMLPPSDSSIKKRRHTEAWSSPLVAVVIVYRTLGDLLPQSPRGASQPVIKTPVVTMVMSGEGVSWPRPITLHLRLLESEGRARPRCVIWSHSAGVNGSCGWSSAGCDLIGRNETHVTCRCVQASSVAVVMDVSRRELPLKRLTFTSLSSSLLLLLITFVLLLGLTDLQSNLHNIHLNQVTSVFLSQLVFLLSIDRTQNQSVCKLAAILLHYCCMCSFCWMLVEELHVYRMLTETRNINHRHMTFYYAIGWGIPAAITGLSVGLDPGGFGSSEFCWLSVQDSVLWTVAGPVSAVLTVTMVMFVLAVKQSVGKKQLIAETAALSSSLRSAILLVLLLSASWLSGLMAVNSDVISFHYLFSALSCLQGVCFFFSYCVFNRELRRNLKELFIRKKSGRELRNNHAAALTRSLNRKQSFPGDEGLYRTAIGESMASLNRNHSGLNCPPSSGSIRKCFHDNNNSLILTRKQFRKESCSSDSSSDASLHSSDGEDEHLRNNQRQEEKDSTTQQGQTLSNHVRPYWQVEPPTAADSERLSEGGGVVGEVNQLNNQSVAENEALPTTPDGSQQPMRRRGILKMRTPPSPTLANRKYLLSESPSPGCPAAYSPSNLSLRQVAGGNRVLVKVIPPSTLLQTRPPLSPRQQYSGVTKMTRTRLAIVGGTEDEHESDCSDETSV